MDSKTHTLSAPGKPCIVYSINGAEPRVIPVPTLSEARAMKYRDHGDRLATYVLELGRLQGAAAYCENCFSSAGTTSLILYDGCGQLRRFI